MANETNDNKLESIFSKRVRAGKRRTYFFDVRTTKANDYYLTITESRKRFNDDGYDRHKIFLYKEDFNKFLKGLEETIEHIKTELMPDFDFDAFNHDNYEQGFENGNGNGTISVNIENALPETTIAASNPDDIKASSEDNAPKNGGAEEVDKW